MLCCCVLMTALTTTFGSLYQDEVEITPKNVAGILAAATLFSLVCIYHQLYLYYLCSFISLESG